jgi:hypothetical protein
MTLSRPMFPPRGDTSRRNFLSQAAAAAAGSAVLAVATVSPRPAIAAPGAFADATKARSELTAAIRSLDEACRALGAARSVNRDIDQQVRQWKVANPEPASKRGLKRWTRKLQEYKRDLHSWESRWIQFEAENQFRAAQLAVARIRPRDANELMRMAAASAYYENTPLRGYESVSVIGYQVALSYVRLHGAAIGGAA